VIAFTGVLVGACRATGFRLRPRLRHRHPRVAATLRQAGWGVVLHTSAGVLLAGSILAGAAVEGGVVAYQVAWVFFLAPYAIFSQPIHTAILPELVPEAAEPGLARFSASVRWSIERIALPIVPVSVLMVVLAGPAMRLVSFGEASAGQGPELLAAALAALAAGLLPYGAFLMLARASYALGDSALPGRVAIGVAAVGALLMAVGAPLTDGTERIAVIGLAHSVAHLVGATVLVVALRRRTGQPVVSSVLVPIVGACVVVGTAAALALRALAPAAPTRLDDLATCLAVAIPVGVVLAALARASGLRGRLTVRAAPVEAIA
jgi:putative peptidoglycan lipid II flippase